MAAPIDEPLSNRATAHPLSRLGNHSETAFVAPGQLAASPRPSTKRNVAKDRSPPAKDVSTAVTEYTATVRLSPTRVPTRSRNGPAPSCPTADGIRTARMAGAKGV